MQPCNVIGPHFASTTRVFGILFSITLRLSTLSAYLDLIRQQRKAQATALMRYHLSPSLSTVLMGSPLQLIQDAAHQVHGASVCMCIRKRTAYQTSSGRGTRKA